MKLNRIIREKNKNFTTISNEILKKQGSRLKEDFIPDENIKLWVEKEFPHIDLNLN